LRQHTGSEQKALVIQLFAEAELLLSAFLSVAPVSVTASPSTICSGDTATMGISGGAAGTGGKWKWYTGSCGGSFVASGASPALSPTVATTYFY